MPSRQAVGGAGLGGCQADERSGATIAGHRGGQTVAPALSLQPSPPYGTTTPHCALLNLFRPHHSPLSNAT